MADFKRGKALHASISVRGVQSVCHPLVRPPASPGYTVPADDGRNTGVFLRDAGKETPDRNRIDSCGCTRGLQSSTRNVLHMIHT